MAIASNAEKSDVKIFHRLNKLKMKTGADMDGGTGFIDSRSIKNAQGIIDERNESYSDEVLKMLKDVEKIWSTLIADKDDDMRIALYHKANHIKDLSETYSYDLMLYFGESLREFLDVFDVNNKAHQTIVRAHIDVMWVVLHEKISDSDDEKAIELKEIVLKAIEKHS